MVHATAGNAVDTGSIPVPSFKNSPHQFALQSYGHFAITHRALGDRPTARSLWNVLEPGLIRDHPESSESTVEIQGSLIFITNSTGHTKVQMLALPNGFRTGKFIRKFNNGGAADPS